MLPAAPDAIATALAEGRDVALWPGGEVDLLRPWTERDRANLAGRTGFVKMAIRAGVPIVPIATVGGADAMPVLIRGDRLSKALQLDRLLRLKVFPLAISLPWGIAPAALPQLPLPAKIRTRFMPAVELDHDPRGRTTRNTSTANTTKCRIPSRRAWTRWRAKRAFRSSGDGRENRCGHVDEGVVDQVARVGVSAGSASTTPVAGRGRPVTDPRTVPITNSCRVPSLARSRRMWTSTVRARLLLS